MKILFIGGTGNISAASVRLAVSKGFDVFVLNRGKTECELPTGVSKIIGDINDREFVKNELSKHSFDVVANFIAFNTDDVERDIEIFNGKISQYLFISSASIYQKEPSHPVVTESTPLLNPYWDYSRHKIACELLLNKAFRETGFPVTIVRPSLTYDTVIPAAIGSWDDFTLIDRIRRGKKIIAHGDGTSLWTVTHSDDFAKGFVGLIGHQQALGHAFHITSDEILTWNQVYEAIAEAAGAEAKIVHIPSRFIAKFEEFHLGNLLGDKAVSVLFDNSKIKKFVPEFKCTIPFKQGIKRTVKWFEADEKRMRIIPETNEFMDRVIEKYESVYENI